MCVYGFWQMLVSTDIFRSALKTMDKIEFYHQCGKTEKSHDACLFFLCALKDRGSDLEVLDDGRENGTAQNH